MTYPQYVNRHPEVQTFPGQGKMSLQITKLDPGCTKLLLAWPSAPENVKIVVKIVPKDLANPIVNQFFGDISHSAVKTRVKFGGDIHDIPLDEEASNDFLKQLMEPQPEKYAFSFGTRANGEVLRPLCIFFDHDRNHMIGLVQSIGSQEECSRALEKVSVFSQLIHEADPGVITIFARVVCPSVPTFQNLAKQTSFK